MDGVRGGGQLDRAQEVLRPPPVDRAERFGGLDAGVERPLADHPESQWLQTMASGLDEVIAESGPRFWLCGHAHTTHQVTIGATRVASNPRAGDGPGHVNPEFAESYVVEL